MIKVVKEFTNPQTAFRAVTHPANFHADDVFAAALLGILHKNVEIVRTLETNIGEDMIFDIGLGEFDHHQKGGNGSRFSGIMYSSFGLLWKKFGTLTIGMINANMDNDIVVKCFNRFDERFVAAIDVWDAGTVNGPAKIECDVPYITLQEIIKSFNPSWDDESDFDSAFEEAVNFAEVILVNTIKRIISTINAEEIVSTSLASRTWNYIILDKFVPWVDTVVNHNNEILNEGGDFSELIKFVISPSARGGYQIQTVRKNPKDFESILLFPKSWAGLKDNELAEVSGIEGATFCHNARFIASAKTLFAAINLAEEAVNSASEEGLS